MELARGTINDRPWGFTLGALATRGFTGRLVLRLDDASHFTIAFADGVLVGATSPVAGDAAARVAVAARMLPAELGDSLLEDTARHSDRDEIEVIGERVGLAQDQLDRLYRRVLAQRVARTFVPARGAFILEAADPPVGSAARCVDVHAGVYLGARVYMAHERLAAELAQYGDWFALEPEAAVSLGRFGFSDHERGVLDALKAGARLGELEAIHRDPHTAQAVVYALLACRLCAPAPVASGRPAPLAPAAPRGATKPPPITGNGTGSNASVSSTSIPAAQSPPASSPGGARSAARGSWAPRNVPATAAPAAGPGARVASGSQNELKRAAGTAPPATMPAATTPAREDRPALAANAYRRGERALDDNALERAITELRRAVELAPNEFHYQATLAWAQFCAADDKPAIADQTRSVLSRAILRSDNPEQAQFFLGRVERMLGREKEALRHFNAVLASQPDHREAASEVRVLEARLGTRR